MVLFEPINRGVLMHFAKAIENLIARLLGHIFYTRTSTGADEFEDYSRFRQN